MNLFARVPGPLAWGLRIVGWTIGLAIIGAMAAGYGNFKLSQHIGECLQTMKTGERTSALVSAQQLVACADKRSGLLERAVLYQRRKAINSLPHVPCSYVGTWSMTRPPSAQMPAVEYRITLRDDSKFVAQPVRSPDPEVLTGSWGVHGGSMLWFYDQGIVWPPDINPIKHASDDAFTLREKDSTITSYALLARTESQSCVPAGGKTITAKSATAPQVKAAAPAPVPTGPLKMRPIEGLSQAQRTDYEQLHLSYIEVFRVLGRAKACNHPDAEARMQALLKEMEQRHGSNDKILMTALLGFVAGNENRLVGVEKDQTQPPVPVPCDAIAAQMANLQLPPIPASLVLTPGAPVDRILRAGNTSTGPYQLVSRRPGEKGAAELLVIHREKIAFRSAQEFEQERLVEAPTPVLLVSTRDPARKCADGKPHFKWQAVSLPSWGDPIVSALESADCMVVWPYSDANGRTGLCAWINTGEDRRPSRIFRIEDHGGVTFSEERRVGACPR